MATSKGEERRRQPQRRGKVGQRVTPYKIGGEGAKNEGPKKNDGSTDDPGAALSPPATTSRSFAHLTDLLGRRAGLRVLWELRAAPLKFRALQAACDGLSPSTLNQRLNELREARLVMIEDRQGYRLTSTGEELVGALGPLASWADSWSQRRAQKRKTDGPPRKHSRSRTRT